MSESNVFRYRPLPLLVLRCEPGTRGVELARLLLAAELASTPVSISMAADVATAMNERLTATGAGRQLRDLLSWQIETTYDFLTSLNGQPMGARVRLLGTHGGLLDQISGPAVSAAPVLATGRRELLSVLREQSVSRTVHRYGHVPPELQR